jgi:hypothetical protein
VPNAIPKPTDIRPLTAGEFTARSSQLDDLIRGAQLSQKRSQFDLERAKATQAKLKADGEINRTPLIAQQERAKTNLLQSQVLTLEQSVAQGKAQLGTATWKTRQAQTAIADARSAALHAETKHLQSREALRLDLRINDANLDSQRFALREAIRANPLPFDIGRKPDFIRHGA